MILVDNGKCFKLKVQGYEFENSTSYHDSNWLKVSIDATDGDLNWVAEDNCLLAYELVRLREWVLCLYDSSESEILFTENELAFRFNRHDSILVVVLEFHFHPKGKNYQYGEGGDEEYLLSFRMNERKIKALLADIEELISLFPLKKRGGEGGE